MQIHIKINKVKVMSYSSLAISVKEQYVEWFGETRIKSSAPQHVKQAYFIEKAKIKHGDKYDYSKVLYTVDSANVTIVCPEHGEFEQKANTHVNRSGCKACARESLTANLKMTLEEVIESFEAKHGNKYDYSKVTYINNNTKVTIICPEHDEFEQTPSKHLDSYGCRDCAKALKKNNGGSRLTTAIFIARSKEKHGDKYDYSNVNYKQSNEKVTIICPEHGEFKQRAALHFKGSKCPKCAGVGSYTTEECIGKFKEVHGDLYDYSKVVYKGNKTYVTITCSEHGEFIQRPNDHLTGYACPKCADSRGAIMRRLGDEGFMKRARLVHEDKYDYSKVRYGETSKSRIVIICPEHGEFEQTASDHLQGNGCQICARIGHVGYHTPDNVPEEKWQDLNGIYVLLLTNSEGEQWLKVGISKSITTRIQQIARISRYDVDILTYRPMPFIDAWNLEQNIHKALKKHRELPCTQFSGHTECFNTQVLGQLAELNMITYAQIDCVENGYPVRNWEIE
jgi:hypothetical protein